MRNVVAVLLAIASFGAVTSVAQQPDADIARLLDEYRTAWNKGDAKALAALYSENAIRVTSEGQALSGRAAIEQSFVKYFGVDGKGTTLTITPERTQNVSADVRLQEGTFEVVGGARGPQRGRYLNTLVREGGQWKYAGVALVPQAPPRPR